MHKKLFIPGPVEVKPEVLEILKTPMIGHRGGDYHTLHSRIRPKLKQLMYTQNDVFISTSSGTGVMEAAIRNCVDKGVLCCVNGAFSERWAAIAKECDKNSEVVQIEWGKAVRPSHIKDLLATGKYDAITFVHNETSTGVMNSLEEMSDVMKEFPDVLWLVDTVSSLGGVKIEVDKLGIDVCLASSQKCLGLPPGLAIFSVSKKALERAAKVKGRGHYFDFLAFKKADEKDETPCTPVLPLFFALDFQLGRILKEGLENRFQRHLEMAHFCRNWATEYFSLFPEKGFESITLTTISNTRNIDVDGLNKELGKRGFSISSGYGKLKGITFRIAHMGDCTLDELKELISHINDILKLK